MRSVNILYIASRDLFHVQYKDQDGSCSLTLLNAENKLYHRKGYVLLNRLKQSTP